jgi:hypothetical protein
LGEVQDNTRSSLLEGVGTVPSLRSSLVPSLRSSLVPSLRSVWFLLCGRLCFVRVMVSWARLLCFVRGGDGPLVCFVRGGDGLVCFVRGGSCFLAGMVWSAASLVTLGNYTRRPGTGKIFFHARKYEHQRKKNI